MGAMASRITSLTIIHSSVYSKKTSKLRVTGFYAGYSPVTGEIPAQMASKAEKVSIGWRHHVSVVIRCFMLYVISFPCYSLYDSIQFRQFVGFKWRWHDRRTHVDLDIPRTNVQ